MAGVVECLSNVVPVVGLTALARGRVVWVRNPMRDKMVQHEAGEGQNPTVGKLHGCKKPPLEMIRVDRLLICCRSYRGIMTLHVLLTCQVRWRDRGCFGNRSQSSGGTCRERPPESRSPS